MTKETFQLRSGLSSYKRSLQDRKRQILVHNPARGTIDVDATLAAVETVLKSLQ